MCSRSIAICASLWTLIVASLYLALSIVGYMAYHCQLNRSDQHFVEVAMNLVYFYNPECDAIPNLPVLEIDTSEVEIDLGMSPPSAERTVSWMTAYICLSTIWIVTSMFLFISSLARAAGGCLCVFLIPWILATTANLTADVVATIIYVADIYATTTFKGLLEFLQFELIVNVNTPAPGITVPPGTIEDIIENFKNTDIPFTWGPSVIMALFFSRGCFVVGLIVLILLIFVIIEAVRNCRKRPKVHQRQWHDEYPNNTSTNFSNQIPRTQIIQQPYENGQNNLQHIPSAPSTIDRINSRTNDVFALSNQTPYSTSPPESSWLARKINNDDFDEKPSNLRKEFENRMSSHSPVKNEELRSQLPWSYTQDRSEQPKRVSPRPESADEAPPVPIPDYTLHFPKRKRDDVDRANIRSITPPEYSPPYQKSGDYLNNNSSTNNSGYY